VCIQGHVRDKISHDRLLSYAALVSKDTNPRSYEMEPVVPYGLREVNRRPGRNLGNSAYLTLVYPVATRSVARFRKSSAKDVSRTGISS
jgi:hypothetical protein